MYTRLSRESPWKAQIGCTAVIALIIASVGFFIAYMTWTRDQSDNRNGMLIFASIWIGVGALVMLSAIHQAFATRPPETIVEIDPEVLVPGQPVRVHILQPGPLNLRSIHVNLTAEETWWVTTRRGKRSLERKWHGPYRMMEIGREAIGGGETLDREGTFTIPRDIHETLESGGHNVRWKIEVWGRVAWWFGFMHPFPVRVVGQAETSNVKRQKEDGPSFDV